MSKNVDEDRQRGRDNAAKLVRASVANLADSYVYYVDRGGVDFTEEHRVAYERLKDAVLAMRVIESA